MRYHRDEGFEPCPLRARLWEAKRGLWLGAVLFAFWCGPIMVLAFVAKTKFHMSNLFVGLGTDPLFMLVLAAGIMWKMWMRELGLNDDSISFKEMTALRSTGEKF